MSAADKYKQQFQSRTAYHRWQEKEGIPVINDFGVDCLSLELGDWKRLGGRGAYVNLLGAQGTCGFYVLEIPPGGELLPEKHLFEEQIYVLSGRGLTEVWQDGGSRRQFEWHEASIFSPPLNAWHRFINGSGQEPARFAVITTAPMVMDLFHSDEFVYNCPFVFNDRFDGRSEYFAATTKDYILAESSAVETNFVPDIRTMAPRKREGEHGNEVSEGGLRFEMAGNVLKMFFGLYPPGTYKDAHWHEPGYIIVIMGGEGYSLMWPPSVGLQPFSDGKADEVIRFDWKYGSAFCPPQGWWHQHFNTGSITFRYVPTSIGSRKFTLRWILPLRGGQEYVHLIKRSEGGNTLDYELEDPYIRQLYEEELRKRGLECRMPPALMAHARV